MPERTAAFRTVRWGMARGGALVAVIAFAGFSVGCSDEDAERFLDALTRKDYDAALAELHSEARATTPTAEALRAQIEASGLELVSYSRTCGASGEVARSGYNLTTRERRGKPRAALVVGVAPGSRGKCNGPLAIDLKREQSLPGKPWKVRGLKRD